MVSRFIHNLYTILCSFMHVMKVLMATRVHVTVYGGVLSHSDILLHDILLVIFLIPVCISQ